MPFTDVMGSAQRSPEVDISTYNSEIGSALIGGL
jgi:hypothetical protein